MHIVKVKWGIYCKRFVKHKSVLADLADAIAHANKVVADNKACIATVLLDGDVFHTAS